MFKLSEKYVFHIPLFKYSDDKLIKLDIDDILDDLINQFNRESFDSFYIINAKSYYKKRSFDEILITMFASSDKSPKNIFINWFENNNSILKQESFAYEINNELIIHELD